MKTHEIWHLIPLYIITYLILEDVIIVYIKMFVYLAAGRRIHYEWDWFI
jgi:hypothetical protein